MKDIADAAGVSVSTVSRVINKTAPISPEVTENVLETMDKLGYQPRTVADINTGQRNIAVFVPDIANEFYAKCVQSIMDEAWKNDYAVVLGATKHQQLTSSKYVKSMIQSGTKGIIFFGGSAMEESLILNTEKKIPVVLGDRELSSANLDSVVTDNRNIMSQSVTRLYHAGYREIGYISEDLHMSNIRDRYQGFLEGMKANGLSIDKNWVICDELLRLNKTENAYELIYNNLMHTDRHPEILLCSSDLIAIGALSALQLAKIRVPREVGVIGFDDISIARYMDPPLTTIAQDMDKLGKQCFYTLLDRIAAPKQPPKKVVVKAKFITRQTVLF